MFEFKLLNQEGSARIAQFKTPHGTVKTPCFMPVGSVGAVKSLAPSDLKEVGAQIVLGNSYHLYLRPGVELIDSLGGLQRFSGWPGAMLTDSGGFQVFSLDQREAEVEIKPKVCEEGVSFKSHLDGSRHLFTPEKVIEIEKGLGADIIMPLDVLVGKNADFKTLKAATERTERWLKRGVVHFKKTIDPKKQTLFGIVQGGTDKELRRQSAESAVSLDLFGYAIGGLSVGEEKKRMLETIEQMDNLLPKEKPRYLMGVGEPLDFLEAIYRGVDMMDCVLPTRLARHGAAWIIFKDSRSQDWLSELIHDRGQGWRGRRVDITGARFQADAQPLMPGCSCLCCRTYTRAALHHFAKIKEPLIMRLLSIHNLKVLFDLEGAAKNLIEKGEFLRFLEIFRSVWR